MSSRKIYILALISCCLVIQFTESNGSFLDWIWPNRNAGKFGQIQTDNLPSIQFELSETDDKFIEDSSKLLGRKLSKADFCQQRVILNLKSSCNNLSDEQLRKLSMDLFNCQLGAESKPIHECSDNMSLEDCTSDLSPEEWNSYNEVIAEAKQICLAIRQDQFRGLTEITINKLASSTHQHLDLMERLQNSQKLLEKATLNSLDEITDSHLKLLDQQQEVLKMSEFQRLNAEANMREILKEKSLLKLGNKELSSFILNLKLKIQEGISGIHSQNEETKQAYASLLSDFEQLNIISSRITSKLEDITEEISERGEENYALLETTKRQIKQIDEVVLELFEIVMKLKTEFNEKVTWIENYLGKDRGVERLTIILIHIGIMLIGMLCLLFCGTDYLSRYLFLGVLGLNFGLTLGEVYELNMELLIKTLGVLLLGNLIVKYIKKYKDQFIKLSSQMKAKFSKHNSTMPRSSQVETNTIFESEYTRHTNRRQDLNLSNGHQAPEIGYYSTPLLQDHQMPTMRSSVTREGSSHSTSSRRSQEFNKCSAITLKGTRCHLNAYDSSGLCTIHGRASRDRLR